MVIQCEQCPAEYELQEAQVGLQGTAVECTACGHVFKARRLARVVGAASEKDPASGKASPAVLSVAPWVVAVGARDVSALESAFLSEINARARRSSVVGMHRWRLGAGVALMAMGVVLAFGTSPEDSQATLRARLASWTHTALATATAN